LHVSHTNTFSIMQAHSKPASTDDFTWYHSEGDDEPLVPSIASNPTTGQHGPERGMRPRLYSLNLWLISLTMIDHVHSQHAGRGGRMAEALEAEKADEYGNPIRRLAARPLQQVHQSKKQSDTAAIDAPSDEGDHNYEESGTTSSAESNSENYVMNSRSISSCHARISMLVNLSSGG
jgi:hypothetical protein